MDTATATCSSTVAPEPCMLFAPPAGIVLVAGMSHMGYRIISDRRNIQEGAWTGYGYDGACSDHTMANYEQ